MRPTSRARAPSRRLVLAIWAGFAFLIVVGVGAAILRARYVPDLGVRLEPVRTAILAVFGLIEPNAARRAAELRRLDTTYAARPVATLVHVGLGAVFLALIPLQFASRLRTRYRNAHRWLGRVLLVVACITGLYGVFFGVVHPFGGVAERVTIGAFGGYFLVACGIAFANIRAHRRAAHREWMLRAVAAALGIAIVRVVSVPIDLVLTPAGASPQEIFLAALWVGLSAAVAGGEWWIWRTRPAAVAVTERGMETPC